MSDTHETEFPELKQPERLVSRAITALGRLQSSLKTIQAEDPNWSWEHGAQINLDMRKHLIKEAARLIEAASGTRPTIVVELYRGVPYILEKPDFVDIQFPGFDGVLEDAPQCKFTKRF